MAKVLLADEPTGNLDEVSGAAVIGALARKRQRGELWVTREARVAEAADRVVRLVDGLEPSS